jgi:hypothetical protein
VTPMPSRAVRPQGNGAEALMPASVAPKGCRHVRGRGVAKPQVKHLIGVSDPHRSHRPSLQTEAALGLSVREPRRLPRGLDSQRALVTPRGTVRRTLWFVEVSTSKSSSRIAATADRLISCETALS